jgi:hypothetical protein
VDDWVFAEPVAVANGLPVISGAQGTTNAAVTINATATVPFTGVVATFSDTDPNGNARDFTALINWGDGHRTVGQVVADGQGGFNVVGSNTYALAGTFAVSVDVMDFGGAPTLSLSNTANVAAAPAPAVFAVGAGPGGLPVVDVFNASTGALQFQFQPFETGFTGGVRVAVAHSNGQDFLAAAAGPGGFLVRTFQLGATGATPIGQFQPFGTFTGGINVALGDLNGDGKLEVVTGPDAAPNSSPFINVWGLTGTRLSPNVFAFEQGFTGGVRVAIGDVDGSGKNEIIASAGPGGLPLVQVINGQTFARMARFQVFGTGFQGGVFVAAGLFDTSGMARVLVGAGGQDGAPGDEPVLRLFDGVGTLLHDFVLAFEPTYSGGVDVGKTRLPGAVTDRALAAPAATHAPQVHAFNAGFQQPPLSFDILSPATGAPDVNFANGAFVGG